MRKHIWKCCLIYPSHVIGLIEILLNPWVIPSNCAAVKYNYGSFSLIKKRIISGLPLIFLLCLWVTEFAFLHVLIGWLPYMQIFNLVSQFFAILSLKALELIGDSALLADIPWCSWGTEGCYGSTRWRLKMKCELIKSGLFCRASVLVYVSPFRGILSGAEFVEHNMGRTEVFQSGRRVMWLTACHSEHTVSEPHTQPAIPGLVISSTLTRKVSSSPDGSPRASIKDDGRGWGCHSNLGCPRKALVSCGFWCRCIGGAGQVSLGGARVWYYTLLFQLLLHIRVSFLPVFSPRVVQSLDPPSQATAMLQEGPALVWWLMQSGIGSYFILLSLQHESESWSDSSTCLWSLRLLRTLSPLSLHSIHDIAIFLGHFYKLYSIKIYVLHNIIIIWVAESNGRIQ